MLMGTNHDEYRVFAALQELGQGAPISSAQYIGFVTGTFGGAAPIVLSIYPLSGFAAPDQAQSTLLTDLAFVCPAITTANLVSANAPTYVYEFDDPTAPKQVPQLFLDQKTYHAAELLYLFRQAVSAWGFGPLAPLDVSQQVLADQMVKYWAAFVTTGNPNVAGLSPWPPYSTANPVVLRLTQGPMATTNTLGGEHQCGFWAGFGV
jgi:para-nitrobenzyl esterase